MKGAMMLKGMQWLEILEYTNFVRVSACACVSERVIEAEPKCFEAAESIIQCVLSLVKHGKYIH